MARPCEEKRERTLLARVFGGRGREGYIGHGRHGTSPSMCKRRVDIGFSKIWEIQVI
jgi:hypothetical protein